MSEPPAPGSMGHIEALCFHLWGHGFMSLIENQDGSITIHTTTRTTEWERKRVKNALPSGVMAVFTRPRRKDINPRPALTVLVNTN